MKIKGGKGNKRSFIMSCGCIVWYRDADVDDFKFLLLQRRDSVEMIMLVRGRYKSNDTAHIRRLFENISPKERSKLEAYVKGFITFDYIWEELWLDKSCKRPSPRASMTMSPRNRNKSIEMSTRL